ncbi:TadE family protein [Archangium sp.]|uniref:TadE/TadG family type IV pilus assembly protein n=1 Tax=Archangium sp. TaxID=1872627 RepID=UPI002ED9D522
MPYRVSRAESGQAAVESALTLPLAVFLVLGTLQLFLMFQARLMTEHAAFRAVRAGSLSQGSCRRMVHAAMTTLLPTFTRTDSPARLAQAFEGRIKNRYAPALDSGHNGDIVWLVRESPRREDIQGQEDSAFDDPDRESLRLEVRLIFWYPMRIPFANWVIARMTLAYWGLQDYNALNPLMVVQNNAEWTEESPPPDHLDDVTMNTSMAATMLARTDQPAGTFVFPIQATAGMRMMTPARSEFFNPQDCR